MESFERIAYLSDPAVWVEPHSDLQERVVSAITREVQRPRRTRRFRFAFIGRGKSHHS